MSSLLATLKDGRTVAYTADVIGEGAMKQVHFTPDRSSVVCFYKDDAAAKDPQRMARLEKVLGQYNPTTAASGEYWKRLFCWPTGIVVKPRLGIVTPTYPKNYFFASGPFQGKDKEGSWFSRPKLRAMLPESERGEWISYFKMCVLMARAVRRLHQAGLAHSDLSSKNILVDPSSGQCIVIDIDSLVVPGVFPPDVIGTAGYIAPECISTQHLKIDDPARRLPSARTDQHALAILLYEYLLFRHPLRGPKVNSGASAEEDERLSMGEKALFVEHPTDSSNKPKDLTIPASVLGPHLAELFQRAFVKGLHHPSDRPAAIEWEKGLVKTWELLQPCANGACTHRWYVLHDPAKPRCPFCGTKPRSAFPLLQMRKEAREGQWMSDGQVACYHNQALFAWHVFDNVYPGEEADRTMMGYVVFHGGQWLLVNKSMASLTSPGGNRVPVGQAVALAQGAQIRLSQEPHGRIVDVKLVSP